MLNKKNKLYKELITQKGGNLQMHCPAFFHTFPA